MVTGRHAEAVDSTRKTVAIVQKLVDTQPSVREFQVCLGYARSGIGDLYLWTGKPAEALEAYRTALPVLTKLAQANPGNTDYQALRSGLHFKIGMSLGRQRRFAEAFAACDEGLGLLQKSLETHPQIYPYIDHLGAGHTYRGSVRVRAGQPTEAAADLRRAIELFDRLTSVELISQLDRSRAQALLAGLGSDANSGVTKAEAAKFADQSVAGLAEIVKAGWALPSELKEPDFDAVRGRADFRKLFAEVVAKAEKPEDHNPGERNPEAKAPDQK